MKKNAKMILFFIPLFILIVLVILGAFLYLPSFFKEPPTEQYIKYRDNVSDLSFYDADNVKKDFNNNYKNDVLLVG